MAAVTHPLTFVTAGSVASSLVATVLARGVAGPEIVLGMLAPLLAVTATWLVIERTFTRNPAGVTGVMIQAFVVKLLFFAIYLVAMLGVLGLRPMPFAISFTCYFVALYVVEALLIKRLAGQGAGAAA